MFRPCPDHAPFQFRERCINPASSRALAARAQRADTYGALTWDLSAIHSFRARRVFIDSIRGGEAAAHLAKAAVAAAAEDDAIGTSIQQLPCTCGTGRDVAPDLKTTL